MTTPIFRLEKVTHNVTSEGTDVFRSVTYHAGSHDLIKAVDAAGGGPIDRLPSDECRMTWRGEHTTRYIPGTDVRVEITWYAVDTLYAALNDGALIALSTSPDKVIRALADDILFSAKLEASSTDEFYAYVNVAREVLAPAEEDANGLIVQVTPDIPTLASDTWEAKRLTSDEAVALVQSMYAPYALRLPTQVCR